MATSYEALSTDERHKASRLEFLAFLLCRAILLIFVVAVMGALMHGLFGFAILALERAFEH